MDWTEAGGDHQLPMIGAVLRVHGGIATACPRCVATPLRHFYKELDARARTGTRWAWCRTCQMVAHQPRLERPADADDQPFAELDLAAFAVLEVDRQYGFYDRLNDAWERRHPTDPEPVPTSSAPIVRVPWANAVEEARDVLQAGDDVRLLYTSPAPRWC